MISALIGLMAIGVVAESEPLPTVGDIMDAAPESVWLKPDPENTLYMDTVLGRIVIMLSSDLAPNHVAQVKHLAREGYYDGLSFYRVVGGFVAQGGDASGEQSTGRAKASLKAEFEEPMRDDIGFTPLGFADGYADQAGYIDGMPAGRDLDDGSVWLSHCSGAFAFGRDTGADTASTEFYITIQPQRYLDRNLTVFGRVILGMEVVQAIPRGALGNGGVIEDEANWTTISRVQVAADVPEEKRVKVQYLDTNTQTFSDLIIARSARQADFFHYRHGYIDLCQLPLPVRMQPAE